MDASATAGRPRCTPRAAGPAIPGAVHLVREPQQDADALVVPALEEVRQIVGLVRS